MIRPTSPHDAKDVTAMFNAINSLDGDRPVVPMTGDHARRDLLGPAPLSILRVPGADGSLAGFVDSNRVFEPARAAGGCIVVDLYARPDFRRRGIARVSMPTRAAGTVCQGVEDGDDEATAFTTAVGADPEGGVTGRILVGAAFDTIADEAAP